MENFQRPAVNDKYEFDWFMIKEFLETVKEGNLAKIKQQVESTDLDLRCTKDLDHNHNSLYYAMLIKDDSNAVQVAKYLVDQGIDPLIKDKLGQTAIYFAAREGKVKCCKFLIEKGTPLNEADLYSQTPIFYACRENKIDVVEMFIDNGAEIMFEDKFGQTCIYYAIREGHIEIINFLIKKGIDLNKCDKKKQRPLNFARKNSRSDIVDLLIKNGAIDSKEVNPVHSHTMKISKKHIKRKQSEDDISVDKSVSKVESTKLSNLKKKVILVKILDDGTKIPLNLKEIEELRIQSPDVFRMLSDPFFMEKIENEAKESTKFPDSWEKIAKKILALLWKVKQAEIFHKPVDPVELGIPDYFDIISKPMDFSTIKKRLSTSCYTNCKEFIEDIELVFENCILYNGEKSLYGEWSNNVRNEYRKLLAQFDLESYK